MSAPGFAAEDRIGILAEGRPPWIPSCFTLIEKEFSEDDGLVNSTMKLVKCRTAECCADRIEKVYQDKNFFNERTIAAVKELFGY